MAPAGRLRCAGGTATSAVRAPGNPQYSGSCILESYPPLGNSVGELATGSISLQGNGPLARAT